MITPQGDWLDKLLKINKDSKFSFREYGSIRLIGKVILAGSFAIVLLLIHNILRKVVSIPYFHYASYAVVALTTLYFLRAGKMAIAKIVYIVGLVGFVFAFASTAPYRTGTHIYFVILILVMIALLNEVRHRVLFPIIFFMYLAYLFATFPGFDPFQRRVFSEALLQSYYFINTSIFFILCYLVLWWIINLHKRYEADLKIKAEQLAQQRDQLEEANKNLDRVVYTVTHDLRAPLNSLQGLLSLAEHAPKEETAEYINLMNKQIVAMKSYIQDIVEYNRNAKTIVEAETVLLADLVQDVVDSLKASADQPINFEIIIPRNIVVKSDPVRVRVVLSNLVGNAVKYADREKEHHIVKITVSTTANFIEIEITDNGIGIDKQHLPKIFDMFYRATTKKEGTGLGLFIVKETIEKLGGQISVSSELGTGSTFRFTLPA